MRIIRNIVFEVENPDMEYDFFFKFKKKTGLEYDFMIEMEI